jgi:hypothetical protein
LPQQKGFLWKNFFCCGETVVAKSDSNTVKTFILKENIMNEKQSDKLMGILTEHRAEFLGLSTEDAQWAIQSPKEAIALFVEAIKTRNKTMSTILETKYLKLISADENLILDACDGSEIIAGSDDMFEAGIDSDFVKWGANEQGVATVETPVEVHELVKNATLAQMFGSLSADVSTLCLTQHQIKNFIRKYRSWLRADGYATLFLFKSNGSFFVARVNLHSDGRLYVYVYKFDDDHVWDAEDRYRIVAPQLAV